MEKFRFLTAGESHGKGLTAIIEGIPSGFEINPDFINAELKRRQQGYGRGGRMKIETDTVEFLSGIRFGKTLGSPVALFIKNKDFENWEKIMSINPQDYTEEKSFSAYRPGHADFAGSVKYNQKDLRNGSHVHWDRKLDGRVAQAVMSIPAIKAVEIGDNPLGLTGSEYHDEMYLEGEKVVRKTNHAGGIEGGMTNGENLVVKAIMKPIPTLRKPLNTVDSSTMQETQAHFERSDTCAVEACAVVAEARIACVLVNEILLKFGGDSLEEILKNKEHGKDHIDCF